MSVFPPIADYAFLSDCEVSTLVAPDGSVEWLCLPRPDSPSAFGALLDRGAGSFRFGPSHAQVPDSRRYVPGTMVLETTWHTPTGWLTVKDLLVMGPPDIGHRRADVRRVPGDSAAQGTMLRIATCFGGRVEVVINCMPMFDYGRATGAWSYDGEGYDRLLVEHGDVRLELDSSLALGVLGARSYGRTTLEHGESAFVSLSWNGNHGPATVDEAAGQLTQTEDFWREWLSMASFPDHAFRPYMERSALALKGLSYAPTGAIMAAATTSLPETPGGERNWDYRYTWIRDTAFMLRALHGLGFDWEGFEYFAFILDAVGGAPAPGGRLELQIMYGIGGERDLTESTLDHLSGYGGARPVRIGNGAYDQQQHDVWGMLLDSIAQHQRNGGEIATAVWHGIAGLVDTAVEKCPEPDQGIWEMRGPPQHFVASKVMCWVAADRGARLARTRDDAECAERWDQAAADIKATVLAKGVSDRGVFRQHFDTDDLDASLLLIPIMGFLPPDDERVRANAPAPPPVASPLVRRALVLVVVAGLVAGATAIGATTVVDAATTGRLRVLAVSTGPRYVTGGDVLVKVRNGGDAPKFSVPGVTITAKKLGKRAWVLSGLPEGRSRISVTANGETASLAVRNHPITGPVFSGPHLPLLCSMPTVAERATEDATCEQETTVELLYRNTAGAFVPVPGVVDPDASELVVAAPPDAATTEVKNRTVPFVVRVERGTINRAPYSFAVPVGAERAWNRRLVYQFGGGCGTGYSQGSELGTNVLDASLLGRGYAVATANFNTFQTSCNDVLSAETAMMVKEHVAETIGKPRYTIGAGASGGAIQQLMIAQNYPGILDALSPVVPFPDAISTAPGVSDCGLLANFYETAGQGFSEEQRVAVNGHRTTGTCALWISSFLSTIDPSVGCDPRIPEDQIFSTENPDGIRCTLQDLNRNEFGVNRDTGYARRPLDNVGVQYGLKAVNDGTITVDQFLELNEKIGGFDINGEIVARRERSTAAEMRHAYRTGRVLSGGGTLRDMPIITVNLYSDAYGDIHDRFRLFTIRERLKRDGRVDRNAVIWTRPSEGDIAAALTGGAFDPSDAVALLDRWLTIGYRPPGAVDNCTDADGNLVSGNDIYTKPGPCRDLYPVFGDPRTAAGAPIVNDRLKCRRQPVDPDAYEVELTTAQAERLREIFPGGVCNWRARGVGQVPLAATWIDFGRPPFGIPPADARAASSG